MVFCIQNELNPTAICTWLLWNVYKITLSDIIFLSLTSSAGNGQRSVTAFNGVNDWKRARMPVNIMKGSFVNSVIPLAEWKFTCPKCVARTHKQFLEDDLFDILMPLIGSTQWHCSSIDCSFPSSACPSSHKNAWNIRWWSGDRIANICWIQKCN